ERLYDLCRGIDHSKVRPHRERKSLSVERTLNQDIKNWEELQKKLEPLFEEFQLRLKKSKISFEQVQSLNVKVKWANFQSQSKEKKVDGITFENVCSLAQPLFWQEDQAIRLIGIGVKLKSKKKKKPRHQLNLF
ncbi:MAG: hypothetical protein AAF202_13710, partial [Pseudomonadota bacterium]